MENSIYVGLSKQIVMRENMNIIANNVANMSTPGYRGQNMVFTEYIENPRYMKEDISMVLDYGQYQKTDAGPVKTTGNSLDIALIGSGFIGVQTPAGIQYSRAGNMGMTQEGVLVNSLGMRIADVGGGDITIPADSKEILIDRTGVVSTEQGQIGQIMIREFASDQDLNPAGNGLYTTTAAPQEPRNTQVLQGKLEGSNVQAVVEMTRMIEVSREYQAVQNMMISENERLRTAIRKLSSTQG